MKYLYLFSVLFLSLFGLIWLVTEFKTEQNRLVWCIQESAWIVEEVTTHVDDLNYLSWAYHLSCEGWPDITTTVYQNRPVWAVVGQSVVFTPEPKRERYR